jgi:hypothetical protein
VLSFYSCEVVTITPSPDPNIKPKHVNKFTCKVNGEFWEAIPKNLNGQFSTNDLKAEIWFHPNYPQDLGDFNKCF